MGLIARSSSAKPVSHQSMMYLRLSHSSEKPQLNFTKHNNKLPHFAKTSKLKRLDKNEWEIDEAIIDLLKYNLTDRRYKRIIDNLEEFKDKRVHSDNAKRVVVKESDVILFKSERKYVYIPFYQNETQILGNINYFSKTLIPIKNDNDCDSKMTDVNKAINIICQFLPYSITAKGKRSYGVCLTPKPAKPKRIFRKY